MSQYTQFSDSGPSSLYESDFATYDISENLPEPSPADLLDSELSITTAPNSEFLRPIAPNIPPSLKRDGPDWKKTFVCYSEMSKNEFVKWWLQTDFGAKSECRKSVRWDAKRKKSETWSHFDQVAHYITGEPKVLCQRCKQIMPHPLHTGQGTTSMGRHFAGKTCQGATGSHQQDIEQSLQCMVYPLTLNALYIANNYLFDLARLSNSYKRFH